MWKNIGFVSWVHHLLCSVRCDDCWFKRYVMAYLLLQCPCPFFSYLTFFFCFLHFCGARRAVIYRWQQAIPPSMAFLKTILGFLNFAYTVLVLNYSCVGFMVPLFPLLTSHSLSCHSYRFLIWCFGQVLSLHETLASYGSVYYIGTVIPITLILLSYIIKPAPARSKARKDQWVRYESLVLFMGFWITSKWVWVKRSTVVALLSTWHPWTFGTLLFMLVLMDLLSWRIGVVWILNLLSLHRLK